MLKKKKKKKVFDPDAIDKLSEPAGPVAEPEAETKTEEPSSGNYFFLQLIREKE